MNNKILIFQCGCCEQLHRSDFWGDCRKDSERFSDFDDAAKKLNVKVEDLEEIDITEVEEA